jgi:lipopolysaccharide/colanic/teichoic acid biosynthesis glycosyltransferase
VIDARDQNVVGSSGSDDYSAHRKNRGDIRKTILMIWINGPAPKTRRPTKGGSLPKSIDVRIFRNPFLRWLRGKSLTERTNRKQTSNKVLTDLSVDGIEPRTQTGATVSESASSFGNDTPPPNKTIQEFLRSVIWEVFSSECRVRHGVDSTGDGQNPSLPFENETGNQPSFVSPSEPQIFSGSGVVPAAHQIPRWKRIFDFTCILLTLPCWLPLTILVMLLIKISSPGPIFYRQERVGYRRKAFMIFKFRTMKVNAETRTHERYLESLMRAERPMTKLDAAGDPRLIAFGRILRASGLDELPQLFNVLRGEMSLVGPRPCLSYEFQRYKPWQQERVNALPGMTGYWQVNGKNKTTFSEMIEMDIFYAKNMSVWLDLTIIIKTVPAIVSQLLESQTRLRDQNGVHVALGGQRQQQRP